jgi:hypothetical protein
MVLACYRSAANDSAHAVSRQRLIIDSPEGGEDKFIHRCNLVAYLLLDGQDADAKAELDRLDEELHSREFDESYLVFYSRALSVAAAALAGDSAEALRRHTDMAAFVASLRWPSAPYVRRRHELLAHVLPTIEPRAPRELSDHILLKAYPQEIGPAWPYYGRLLPCAELSFWSDS